MPLGAALGGAKVSIEPARPKVADAAAMLLKAVHGNDAMGVEAALRLGYEACKDASDEGEYDDKD